VPRKGEVKRDEHAPPAYQTLVTGVLLLIWVALMTLGVLTILQPQWLQDLGGAGRRVEARTYAEFGDRLLREGEYLNAIPRYERSLEIQPDQVQVQAHLAVAWIKAGELEKGEKMLTDALAQAPSEPSQGVIYYNLAESLEGRGRIEEAILNYRQALRFYAEEDRVYRKLGALHFQLAEQRVKQMRNLAGQELAEARRLAGQDIQQARLAFEKALASQMDPTLPYKRMLHQRLAVEEPEYLPAIEEQLMAGVRLEDLARYDLEIIRRTLQTDRKVAETHNFLGSIYGQLGQLGKAKEHFEESLRIWPGNSDAVRNLERLKQMQSTGR
jgi:tetratricopeptide (TPR) repeat protein